jgi:FkbH-like protein
MSDRNRDRPAAKPWVAAKSVWREYAAECERAGLGPDLRVGIASSFTDHTFVPFLGAHLVREGLRPNITVGPYNQLFQVCLDPTTHFGDGCDAIVLLWRIEDLMGDELAAFLGGEAATLTRANQKLSALLAAISQLRAGYAGMLIVGIPPFPTGLSAGPLALDNSTALGAFHRCMTAAFIDGIAAIEGVRLFDLDVVQRVVGLAASFDPTQWYLYRQPFTDMFLHEAGILLGRTIVAARRSPRKCVILDCDNTLWGGIIGEDGLDGIYLGEEFPGSAYRDFQKLLLHWRQQGVLLAIASKNNEADVFEVFDRHQGMVLKRSHISAAQIHWRPKAESIPLIAKALNIGIDAFVFIDDSLMEIEYMRQAHPQVCSVQLPEEPAEIVSTLQNLTLFDRLEVSQEDRTRGDMMRAELDREALSVNLSKEDFLRALSLRVELFRVESADLGRVAQLINKTNQFNLTTIRRTLDEVRVLASSPEHRLFGLRVTDKFGDYGLTGVCVVQVEREGQTWNVDTLLLSCRVLGRGVETVMLAGVAEEARLEGAGELQASFVPTRKNELAATFLPAHKFTRESDTGWRISLAEVPPMPHFVELVRAPRPDTAKAHRMGCCPMAPDVCAGVL